MRHFAIVDGHPDPSEARLVHALAERYAQAAQAAGHEVRRLDVARMDFPLLRDPADFYEGRPPEVIQNAQRDIAWADHLVFFYPLWDGDMPALLKAFIEQTFRPGFSLEYGGRMRFPKRLLTGKSARIIVTMGMPAFIYRTYFGAHALKSFKRSILELCGITPVHETLIGNVTDACEGRCRRWLEYMAVLAERDGAAEVRRRSTTARALARTGCLLACAYLAYAAAAWSRYGKVNRATHDDALLDRVMPEYEVSVQHRTAVNAPAALAFEAIRETDIERSPVVRALFRAREILFGATHVEQALPHGLMEQIAALGWTIVAEEPGRELVLGTVTQPWQPNPTFGPVQPDEFARFDKAGYAKIAFTLRIDPIGPELCEARTETRVQTTDPISRSRFRRYWAFLSPGIALIRLVLLHQVKAEAESRWNGGSTT